MSKLSYGNDCKGRPGVKQDPEEVKAKNQPVDEGIEDGDSTQASDNEASVGLLDGDADESENDEEKAVHEFQTQVENVRNSIDLTYDPDTEPLPNLPAYRPEFILAESLCARLFTSALLVLDSSSYSDVYTVKLRNFIEEMQTPKYPSAKKIAFKGDSGVGKSSIINALLNVPNLSAQGSSGSACTCVITEYRQASENQKSPFLAEVEFYDVEQINAMLLESYANYYAFYVERPSDLEGEELEVVERKATTAKDVFQALYGDRTEFKDDKSTKEFLSVGQSGNDRTILEQLSQWASDMIHQKVPEGGILCIPATSAEELSNMLEPYVEMQNQLDDEESRRAMYWPLVRRVYVGLQSSLLARGLIIADLPGLSDTNVTRQNTTLQYLQNCAYVAIVAPIKRVLTDDGVHRKLMSLLQRKGKNKLLICTMIDDLDPATKGSSVATTSIDAARHDLLAEKYKSKKQEVLQARKSIKTLKGAARQEADKRRIELSQDETIYSALVKDSLIKMRNEKVRKQIRIKYVGINDNARDLAISFVSLRDYELHLEGYSYLSIPSPVITTGVPNLRYRLSSIPAEDSLSFLEHYYQVITRGMIDTLSIWASQSPFERRQEIRTIIEHAKEEVEKIIVSHVRELRQLLQVVVLKPIAEASRGEWGQDGLKLMDSLHRMHASSFSAWCRNDGEHETASVSYRNWNDELLQPVRDGISEIWHTWEAGTENCNNAVSARFSGLIDQIRDDLKPIINNSLMQVPVFLQTLTTKKHHLLKELANFSKALKDTTDKVYGIATSTDRDGALMEAMIPIYQRLLDVKGKSQGATRKQLLRDAVKKGEPFSRLCSTLDRNFDKSFDKEEATLIQSSQKIFDLILQDCDLQFSVEELPDESRDVLKEEVADFVSKAEFEYNEVIAKAIAKAKM